MQPLLATETSQRARTVLVTGAGKRLGREIALHLAQHGWQVAVHYRQSQEDALKTVADCTHQNCTAAAFDADFADEAAVRGLVPRVVAHFGSLDAVVNSASTFEHDDVASFSYANLARHLMGNTAAPILLAQALHSHVRERAADNAKVAMGSVMHGEVNGAINGVVVNLLDQKLWNPNPDFLSYTLSKAALESANTLLAQALAPALRVVGVAPGLTLTSHMLSDAQFQGLHKLSPLGRSSTVQDVVAAVRFALENQSITGTTLLVDGGQHLMRFERDFSLM